MQPSQKKIVREFFLCQDGQNGGHGVMERIVGGKNDQIKKTITPRGAWLLLPEEKLAKLVLGEYQSLQRSVQESLEQSLQQEKTSSKKLGQDLRQSLKQGFFSALAMTVIDNVMERRDDYNQAFLSSIPHDTIVFVDDSKTELLEHLTKTWQPLWDWAGGYYGTDLPIVHGLQPPAIDSSLTAAVQKNIATWDDWFAGAVFYLATLLQSPMIALFATHHAITAEQLYAYGFAEQVYQEEKWGSDNLAKEKKAATISEIKATQEFLQLVEKMVTKK